MAKYGDPCVVCTHTVVNIHLEQWAANAAAPGEQLGVRALLKGLTSVVVLKVERVLVIHSPHLQSQDSNPRPSGYKSNSLSIRPRLPPWAIGSYCKICFTIHYAIN